MKKNKPVWVQQPDDEWLRLDNAALIYPVARNRNWTALFRISAELTEPVQPAVLQAALERTLRRFPAFTTRLRRGLFWYYLERIHTPPTVQEDVCNPCVRMDLKREGGYMFRVRYHNCRIAVEIFHVLTDGTGGLIFLKTLVAEYLSLRYGAKIPRGRNILDCDAPPPPDELEDSFPKYARNEGMSRTENAAYRLRGTHLLHDMRIVTGLCPAQAVREKAQQYNATVNEFLTAVLICSIAELQQRERSKRRRLQPVKINVPINLRSFYPSHTLRNFASYVNPGVEPRYGSYTFEEVIKAVHSYMGLEVTEKRMNARFSANVNSVKSAAIRMAPLPLKHCVLKAVYLVVGDRYTSSSISNMGVTVLPEEMQQYVTRMDLMLGPLHSNPVTCACLTYNGTMALNFTRTILESEVERGFFTRLVKMGIPVKVESNQREPVWEE